MKKYIVVKEASQFTFESMIDGLSEQGYEIEKGSFNAIEKENDIWYIALMSKEIE